jgi:dihydrofolate synthase/folylpolyglutamate synthase
MSLDRSQGPAGAAYPGEPAIAPDLPLPFQPPDEATRWLFALNRFGIRPGLDRIAAVLADLGHPEQGLPTLVVAGTNGKGSTTRALACLLQAAGHRVATYTSPHLLQVYERILIDDVPLPPGAFADYVDRMRPLADRHGASWFEVLTAMSVAIARDAGVDFLCCEAGLGGRLDATNALPARATLLTSVGLDHQAILGETRQAIAAEKLGLLKRGAPLFCAVDEDLRAQVFQAAVIAGSPCHFLDELARWEAEETAVVGGANLPTWRLTLRDRVVTGLPDPGAPVLRRNIALALLTLAQLENRAGERLLPMDPAAALRDLFLPGRFQLVLRDPDWILDTAHNHQALTEAFGAFAARPCRGRRFVLFGAMHDKDLPVGVGQALHGCGGVLGAPVALPRSRGRDDLTAMFTGWGLREAGPEMTAPTAGRFAVVDDLPAALRRLAPVLTPADAVLVTGSCFLVAEVLHHLGYAKLADCRAPKPAGPALAGWVKEGA